MRNSCVALIVCVIGLCVACSSASPRSNNGLGGAEATVSGGAGGVTSHGWDAANVENSGGVAGASTVDAHSIVGPTAMDAATEAADAAEPAGACGAPIASGLLLWLNAGRGVVTQGQEPETVMTWADLSGSGEVAAVPTTANKPKGHPLLVPNAINGRPVIRSRGNPDLPLDPNSDLLEIRARIAGLAAITVALVSATPHPWTSDPTEWCHRGTDTGCSSTYDQVFGWYQNTSWGGVYLSPRDTEIGFRFGPGNDLDSHCFVNNDISGLDPCMKWPRKAPAAGAFTMTIAVHDATSNRLYVQGDKVSETPVAHNVAAVDAIDVANIGNSSFAHNGGADIAEIVVYNRALADDERQALEQYLRCEYFPH